MSAGSSSGGLFPPAPSSSADVEITRRAWEAGLTVLPVEEVDEMPLDQRVEYLSALHRWQVDQAITDGPYQRYREYEQRCKHTVDEITRERCHRQRWEHSPHCLEHSSLDEIDPKGASERRKAARRARAEKLTDKALDELEAILFADTDEIAPSIRVKAIEMAFDRGGLPKVTEQKQEITGEVTHTVEHREFIDSKLADMRKALLNRELAGIEAASAELNGEITEAELVEEAPEEDTRDVA
jgi:hypothetical protein